MNPFMDGYRAALEDIQQALLDVPCRCTLTEAARECLIYRRDVARIVAGYRSVMPGFQQFYEEKPTPPPLPPSVGVPEKRWFR